MYRIIQLTYLLDVSTSTIYYLLTENKTSIVLLGQIMTVHIVGPTSYYSLV